MGIAHAIKKDVKKPFLKDNKDLLTNKLSLLVVEDSDLERELLVEVLSGGPYEIYSASNAFTALEILSSKEVDIVISDLMMPVMDGIELCKEVKSLYGNTYFMLLTAKDDREFKISGLNSGSDDYITKPYDVSELLARVNVASRIIKSNKKLIFLNEELEKVVETDELSGLKNRRYFFKELDKESNRSRRYGHTLAVIMLDLDNLKQINDTYGHIVGDSVLKHISRIMLDSTRETDVVCRYGGDEFIILLPETTPKNAFTVGEKIRRNVANLPYKYKRTLINLTVSVGISVKTPSMSNDVHNIIESADKALYISKNRGKNKAMMNKNYKINELL